MELNFKLLGTCTWRIRTRKSNRNIHQYISTEEEAAPRDVKEVEDEYFWFLLNTNVRPNLGLYLDLLTYYTVATGQGSIDLFCLPKCVNKSNHKDFSYTSSDPKSDNYCIKGFS